MQEHQQRVVDELKELEAKRTKLGTFIGTSQIFSGLPHDERDRLRRQFDIMVDYEGILSERIAAFRE